MCVQPQILITQVRGIQISDKFLLIVLTLMYTQTQNHSDFGQ